MSGDQLLPAEPGNSALVIGASISGLLAARVLADFFARVVVIERDTLPVGAAPRAGLPQARHVHVMLTRGWRILCRLFPGLDNDLAAAGAVPVDWTNDCLAYSLAGWAPRFASGMVSYTCSRDLLEAHLRRRLAALPNVTFVTHHEVIGLLPGAAGAVGGVRLRPRPGVRQTVDGRPKTEDSNQPTTVLRPPSAALTLDDNNLQSATLRLRSGQVYNLQSELVVDASGRDSHAPAWLAELGYATPAETTVNSFLGYASRTYQMPPATFSADWKVLLLRSVPPGTRGGVIFPVEGQRWMVTLGGIAHDYPPTDDDGFLAFARSLPAPGFAEALAAATPVGPVSGYRRTANRMRHYERMPGWPVGFAVLGDAACAFNPVYGQGMTAAALDAETLATCLRRQQQRGLRLAAVGHTFQRNLARSNMVLWLMATGEDFRYPTTEGHAPDRLSRLAQHYFDRLLLRSAVSPTIHRTVIEVLHLMRPPAALFGPALVARALLAGGADARH